MITNYSVVRCSFMPCGEASLNDDCNVEVFFAESQNLDYELLKKHVSEDESQRATQLRSADDRRTFICCHAVLRLILSGKLKTAPSGLLFIKGRNNKPFLAGNQLHFNISHTRKAFAIAVSDKYTGIDLENIDRRLDMRTIMDSTFSCREKTFITQDHSSERERFFLLWTRKEAFLKAVGTGIIHDLRRIKVSEQCNVINRKAEVTEMDEGICDEHFIYSMRISENMLSLASPKAADVKLNVIDEKNFAYIFNDQLNFTKDSAISGM